MTTTTSKYLFQTAVMVAISAVLILLTGCRPEPEPEPCSCDWPADTVIDETRVPEADTALPCPLCGGTGKEVPAENIVDEAFRYHPKPKQCRACKGSGVIEKGLFDRAQRAATHSAGCHVLFDIHMDDAEYQKRVDDPTPCNDLVCRLTQAGIREFLIRWSRGEENETQVPFVPQQTDAKTSVKLPCCPDGTCPIPASQPPSADLDTSAGPNYQEGGGCVGGNCGRGGLFRGRRR